jgi:hypothetical protein
MAVLGADLPLNGGSPTVQARVEAAIKTSVYLDYDDSSGKPAVCINFAPRGSTLQQQNGEGAPGSVGEGVQEDSAASVDTFLRAVRPIMLEAAMEAAEQGDQVDVKTPDQVPPACGVTRPRTG